MDTVNIGDTDLSSVTYSRKLPILERMCALFLIAVKMWPLDLVSAHQMPLLRKWHNDIKADKSTGAGGS